MSKKIYDSNKPNQPLKENRIFVDTRENADVYEELIFLSSTEERYEIFEIIEKQLVAADLMYGSILGAERKELSDLIQSIHNGRIFQQCHKIAMNFTYGYILLAFNPSDIENESDRKACLTTLADCEMRYNMHCRFCGSEEMLVYYFLNLCYKLKKQVKPKWYMRKPEPSLKDEKLLVLTGIAKIGLKKGLALFNKFSSLKNIFNATIEEMTSIPKIGKANATHIKEIYEDDSPVYEIGSNKLTKTQRFKV